MTDKTQMREVRNSDGLLVCRIDETTGTVEIIIKRCVTLIKRIDNDKYEVVNTKTAA